MMYGRGQILRIDLSSNTVTKEAPSPELCRKWLGGEGINDWLLWEHFLKVDPRIDPMGPDNILIAGLGPLGGTGYGPGSKMKWTFKSPVYNLFGDSSCGGRFGSTLRWAGYDHVVITGKAKAPVYIWIDDENVKIMNASHLWGKDTDEVHHLIREELGDERVQVAAVGRAAENGVTFASIVVCGERVAGRTGGGSVMASKNVKAIAVRGTRGIQVYDPLRFREAIDEMIATMNAFPENLDAYRAYGTLTAVTFYQVRAGNAFRNCQLAAAPDDRAEKLSHEWYAANIAAGPLTCSPGCIMGCSGWYKIKGNETPMAEKYAGSMGVKLEYLMVANFGLMVDLPDMTAVTHLAELSNKYGMDVMEVGGCCGLLMELWQRGLIDEKDTAEWVGEPLSLEWGNVEAIEKIMRSMALQDNQLGKLLRGGTYKAAAIIQETKNVPALQYAICGKGGSPFSEDIRSRPSWATNMAVASRGSCHLKGWGTLDQYYRPDISKLYFGTEAGADPQSITLKGASSAATENRTAVINSLGLCVFPVGADAVRYPMDKFCRALSALTGEEITAAEMSIAGERIANLEKAFNSRLGYRREDDRLCHRWLYEPKPNEPGQGWKAIDFIDQVKDEYYEYRGWDKDTSLQKRKKLDELDMLDVAAVLQNEGALA